MLTGPRFIQREGKGGRNRMSDLDRAISDLVVANRILANEDVVDAYGLVSIRH